MGVWQSRIKGKSFSEIKNWLTIRVRHQLLSRARAKPLRNSAIWLTSKFIGTEGLMPSNSVLIKKENMDAHLKELKKTGIAMLDYKLNPQIINEIITYSETLKCFDPYRKDLGDFNPKDATQDSNIAHFHREDLIKSKLIMDLANDPMVLSLVQSYLGAKPTISNVCMWWSFGNRLRPQEAQNFHRDNDDIKFCKLFFYLTDVSAETGPHIYVKNTYNDSKLRKIRRFEDHEIEQTFGRENIVTITGDKGVCFIADTYGFHKGLVPKSADRLLLQIEYSFFPIGYQDYTPVHVDYENRYSKHFNRLLIKNV